MTNFDKTKTVLVWDWLDAPQSLKDLSPHGGDEDWVALVPFLYNENSPVIYSLLLQGGINNVATIDCQWGKVYIAAHS